MLIYTYSKLSSSFVCSPTLFRSAQSTMHEPMENYDKVTHVYPHISSEIEYVPHSHSIEIFHRWILCTSCILLTKSCADKNRNKTSRLENIKHYLCPSTNFQMSTLNSAWKQVVVMLILRWFKPGNRWNVLILDCYMDPLLQAEIGQPSIGVRVCICNRIHVKSGMKLHIHSLTSTAVELNRRWRYGIVLHPVLNNWCEYLRIP